MSNTGTIRTYDDIAPAGGDKAMRQLGSFFTMDDPVHHSLRKVAAKLNQLQIPYAIAGAMALNAHAIDARRWI